MKVVCLESGCCGGGKLEAVARKAVERLGLDVEIESVTDLPTIMSYGIMSTPALVVDGQIRLAGRVPSVDEVASLLSRGLS